MPAYLVSNEFTATVEAVVITKSTVNEEEIIKFCVDQNLAEDPTELSVIEKQVFYMDTK